MGIRHKIPLAFALALLLTVVAGVAGLFLTHRSLDVLQSDVLQRVADERAVQRMAAQFDRQKQAWQLALLRGMDMTALNQNWAAFEQAERALMVEAQGLRPRLADPALQQALDRFTASHRQMGAGYRVGLTKFKQAGLEPSVGDMAVRGIDQAPAGLLTALQTQIAQRSAEVASDAFTRGRRATLWSLVWMLAACVCGVGIGVVISRAVVRPLQHAINVASDVANGDLSRHIAIQSAAPGNDETAQLLSALWRMQHRLRDLVSQVRSSAETVASASAQIAQGSEHLAGRSEGQLVALQQTVSSMTHLRASSEQNLQDARRASERVNAASGVAERGGCVVREAVGTMRAISESSRRIGDIIGVIDGIAFQTNILALNASVEAARAGELGRGFAVVAEEVRMLAHRSAEAAREVRSLISASVERVDHGCTLVDEAGRTMDDVVAEFQAVSTLVARISEASAEQRTGVQRIGEAVTRIDEGTQRNAAMVQQASAAAIDLRRQAAHLVETVTVFRV